MSFVQNNLPFGAPYRDFQKISPSDCSVRQRNFKDFPKEIQNIIFTNMPIEEIPLAACVCKLWNENLKEKASFSLFVKNREINRKGNVKCF